MSAHGGATTVATPLAHEEPRLGAAKSQADALVRRSGGVACGPPPVRGAVGRGAAARQGCLVQARCCGGSQLVAGSWPPGARWRRCLSPEPTCALLPSPPRLDLSPEPRCVKPKAALAAGLAALHFVAEVPGMKPKELQLLF